MTVRKLPPPTSDKETPLTPQTGYTENVASSEYDGHTAQYLNDRYLDNESVASDDRQSWQTRPLMVQTIDSESLSSGDPRSMVQSFTSAKGNPEEKPPPSQGELPRGAPPSYADVMRRRKEKRTSVLLACTLIPALWVLLYFSLTGYFHHSTPQSIPTPNPSITPTPAPAPASAPTVTSKIELNGMSNPIRGTYPLRQILDLKTTSGSISITIEPQPDYPDPGTIHISSTSGSINVEIAPTALGRTYHTTIRSTSGSITTTLQHSPYGSTTISAQSGSIKVNYVSADLATKENLPKIGTSTTSGSTRLTATSLNGFQATNIFQGSVTSVSGSLKVAMPRTWEGTVHARSLGSGNVKVKGPGLVMDWPGGNRDVRAHRGSDGGIIDILSQGSGSVNFDC